jgi:hypothetical protein
MWLKQEIRDRRANRRTRALNRAVWELPAESRRAMLSALEAEDIIVGAYTDRRGRICPALAAHRRGARAGVGDFPRAWDNFARARRPRLATARELEILRAVLEESLPPRSPVESVAPVVVAQALTSEA